MRGEQPCAGETTQGFRGLTKCGQRLNSLIDRHTDIYPRRKFRFGLVDSKSSFAGLYAFFLGRLLQDMLSEVFRKRHDIFGSFLWIWGNLEEWKPWEVLLCQLRAHMQHANGRYGSVEERLSVGSTWQFWQANGTQTWAVKITPRDGGLELKGFDLLESSTETVSPATVSSWSRRQRGSAPQTVLLTWGQWVAPMGISPWLWHFFFVTRTEFFSAWVSPYGEGQWVLLAGHWIKPRFREVSYFIFLWVLFSLFMFSFPLSFQFVWERWN